MSKQVDHFYTTNRVNEHLSAYDFVRDECFILKAPEKGAVKLHRYYFPSIQNHFYCIDPSMEDINYAILETSPGWVFPNKNYSKLLVPLYRYYNPLLQDHFYTIDPDENLLNRNGYHFEKRECYVYKKQIIGTIPFELWTHKGTPSIHSQRQLSRWFKITGNQKTKKLIKKYWWVVILPLIIWFIKLYVKNYFKDDITPSTNNQPTINSTNTRGITNINTGPVTNFYVDTSLKEKIRIEKASKVEGKINNGILIRGNNNVVISQSQNVTIGNRIKHFVSQKDSLTYLQSILYVEKQYHRSIKVIEISIEFGSLSKSYAYELRDFFRRIGYDAHVGEGQWTQPLRDSIVLALEIGRAHV